MEMMQGMSRVADSYGLDVWIWYPAMDKDYADAKTVESALREWGEVFAKLSRIDAVFVPGGDPGHTQPKVLMALLEKQTQNLHRYHPKAQMWVSPQSFNQAWLEEFIDILKRDQPAWLSGVVFGPQVRISLPRLRELVPAKYPIRHYPDITHSRQCQYPVADWDVAYALTEARECINPRPEAEAIIFRKTQPDTIGFLTYSEGCNDDVNKIIWCGLGWDPDARVVDILRQYSRYFIGERYTDDFAQGLLALERNWQGPLLANESVDVTLQQFQALEKKATPTDLKNWRFQQALFRAYYDAYVRHRLIYETDLEMQRDGVLAHALRRSEPARAISDATEILDRALAEHPNADWRTRIFQLAEALFQSIGMQLSVELYQAIAVDRGASLDTLDYPLNNRAWLEEQFARIRKLASAPERLKAVEEILQWTNPGPGGFYDDLGNIACQPHLLRGLGFSEDPGCFQSARVDFEEDLVVDEPDENPGVARRVSWMDHAEALYDAPLQMAYTGLDPQAALQSPRALCGRQPQTEDPIGRQRHPRSASLSGQADALQAAGIPNSTGSDAARQAHAELVCRAWPGRQRPLVPGLRSLADERSHMIMKTKTSQLTPAWKNPVKELLKKGKSVVGIVISSNSVEVAAQAAALGFDFLWLEMEHSPHEPGNGAQRRPRHSRAAGRAVRPPAGE